MGLSATDRRLLAALERGLPLVPHPYRALAQAARIDEAEALERLARLQASGVIKRLGLVVRHHELGYRANAMVVWDVPDEEVDAVGEAMAACRDVTLCYRRARHPEWPYNLYCMIHGRRRPAVEARIAEIALELGIAARPRAVLFSTRRFKQEGARYLGAEVR
jgi:siroheme decarboxylase